MNILGFKQILIIAGFLLALISIPLSFTLIKNTQIFQSQANLEKKSTSLNQQVTKVATKSATASQEVPADSPMSDLKKLLEGAPGTSTTGTSGKPDSPTPTPEVNLAFGPTLNFKVTLEGRAAGKNAAKIFIGIASGGATTKPTYILTFTVDVPDSGSFSGLSLAGLNPGSSYTAYVKGPAQIDSASTFSMGPTESSLNNGQAITLLSGDLNEDNTINSADYTIAKSLYGSTSASSNWNSRADFNLDKLINNLDLAYVIKNFGKTGSSSIWYSSTPTATSSGTPAASSSGSPAGGYWLWIP